MLTYPLQELFAALHRQLLSDSPQAIQLRYQTFDLIWQKLSAETMLALMGSIAYFTDFEHGIQVLIHYPNDPAVIGFAANWDRMNEFCNCVRLVSGVGRVTVAGTDNLFVCWWDGQQWIREVPGRAA